MKYSTQIFFIGVAWAIGSILALVFLSTLFVVLLETGILTELLF